MMAGVGVLSCCRMLLRRLLLRKAATVGAICLFLVAITLLQFSIQQFPETATRENPWRPATPSKVSLTASTSSSNSTSSRPAVGSKVNASSTVLTTPSSSSVSISRVSQCMVDSKGTADIQMSAVFDKLAFDDIDGGVWKQGYPIRVDASRYSMSSPLTVFVVPHSHCDPGWLRTVDDYYNRQTRNILTYMTTALLQNDRRRFIWAEISFLSMWWREQSEDRKRDFRRLVKEGRLEIVTGGWVMNDEANSHYYAMIDQLIEGHLWVEKEIGVTPQSGWAVDPFGYSPTMAYLLKRAGFRNMFVQRLHYSVKKLFSQEKLLEFGWRQHWDKDGSTDIFCHATPFYSYDIPHTCGPDPSICCQFDFIRAAGTRTSCPWRINPKPITSNNVRERVELLADQYRKKAQLYRTRYLIAPLGDDFRYDTEKEVRAQFTNYEKIMDYVDAHPELNIKIKFGTLTEYFNAVRQESSSIDTVASPAVPSGFPTLSGDFYTYSDKAQEYWSGYYTSRPFTKHVDRVLEGTLRAAEILLSLTLARNLPMAGHAEVLLDMQKARRELALFQHHDGVTGTAREAVVKDYIDRLMRGVAISQRVISAATQALLLGTRAGEAREVMLEVDRHYPNPNSVLVHREISLKDKSSVKLVIVNPVGYQRSVLVRVRVDVPDVKVVELASNTALTSQLSPVWEGPCGISNSQYELVFPVTLSPLGLHSYLLSRSDDHAVVAEVFTINCPQVTSSVFNVQSRSSGGGDIELQSGDVTASFSSSTGLLRSVQLPSRDKIKMVVDMVMYGAMTGKARSGAYLFLPDRDAWSIIGQQNGQIGVVSGHLVQAVRAAYDVVTTTVELHAVSASSHGLSIHNSVDIRALSNKELAMRIDSGIANSNGVFFTDLNGYQLQRRQTLSKLPTQGNFYPMPTAAILEDDDYRLLLLSDHSAGVASLKQGWLETVLDRRLMQDDNRGLGQPLKDNKAALLSYHLLLEPRPQKHPQSPMEVFHSLLGHTMSDILTHPPLTLIAKSLSSSSLVEHFSPSLSLLAQSLPCGVHLLNLRSLGSREAGLLLHHRGVDCAYTATPTFSCSSTDQLPLADLFSQCAISSASEVSLTLLHKLHPLTSSNNYTTNLRPMEIHSYRIMWK